jgi:hypothetical protein
MATDGPSLEEELGSGLFARLAALSDAFPRRGDAVEPEDDWERIEAANLRLHLAPDGVLVLHSAAPDGADSRFSRIITFYPATADAEQPA